MNGLPSVIVSLHRKPNARAIADELTNPRGHVGTDADIADRDPVQSLSANAQESSDLSYCPFDPQFGQNLFDEDDAGVYRLARSYFSTINRIFLIHILKIFSYSRLALLSHRKAFQ
jgi:hypothetical protein